MYTCRQYVLLVVQLWLTSKVKVFICGIYSTSLIPRPCLPAEGGLVHLLNILTKWKLTVYHVTSHAIANPSMRI